MDRADWDDDRRFEGGIFSGRTNGTGQRMENRMRNYPVRQGPCSGCPYCRQKKDQSQTALVALAAAAIIALLLAFVMTLLCLIVVVSKSTAPDLGTNLFSPEPLPYELPSNPFMEEKDEESEKAADNSEYYNELYDAIRTDLSYTIDWENYEFAGNNETVMITVDYPVIQGEVPNLELLNTKIAEESDYFEEYYAEYSKYMMPGEVFAVYAEGFVTYMDEEILSIVFCETIYTDYWTDCGLFCINIDIENGVILDNRSMVEIDDAFAVDFRIRSREQNGTIGELEYMTDQEICQYLSNGSTAILFYTPLGMEIGLNYGESYVTVTYKDYERYLQRF